MVLRRPITKHKVVGRVGSFTYREDPGSRPSAPGCSRPRGAHTTSGWWWPACEQAGGSRWCSRPPQPASFWTSPCGRLSRKRTLRFSQSCTVSPDTLNRGRRASWCGLRTRTNGHQEPKKLCVPFDSPGSFLFVFFPHCPVKKIREDAVQ